MPTARQWRLTHHPAKLIITNQVKETAVLENFMKRHSLATFETTARRLVETTFRRWFGGALQPADLALQLARAVEEGRSSQHAAPVQYRIFVQPQALAQLRAAEPALAARLAEYVVTLAAESELTLTQPPEVTLLPDDSLPPQAVRVEFAGMPQIQETTQVHRLDLSSAEVEAAIYQLDAYVIVAGRQHVPLTHPVISIGRRTDNDIVLDRGSVSRQHAQIRWRYGRFILYDVSNRGRTRVNGEPVTEHLLQAGDVIALSDVMLIYGEGQTGPRPTVKEHAPEAEDADTRLLPPTDGA